MKKQKENNSVWWCCCKGGLFWGILFLVLGLWFLAKNLDYIPFDFSIWPIILIILGIWMIIKRNNTC